MFALVLAAFALVACGGRRRHHLRHDGRTTTTQEESGGGEKEAEGGTAGSAATVDFEADPSGALAYTTDKASAKAGKVTVNFTNPQPVPHDVAIEDASGETIGKTEVIAEGSDSTTRRPQTRQIHLLLHRPGPPRSRAWKEP